MEYFEEALSPHQLFPISDPPEVIRTPENFNAQWWERADFYLDLYEYITETITPGTATSVEIKVLDSTVGLAADITVEE
jgi:hypothetical protein